VPLSGIRSFADGESQAWVATKQGVFQVLDLGS